MIKISERLGALLALLSFRSGGIFAMYAHSCNVYPNPQGSMITIQPNPNPDGSAVKINKR